MADSATGQQPHFGTTRHGLPVHMHSADHLPAATAAQRFNKRAALAITNIVGTMWCAYAFGVLALLSLPAILTQAFTLRVFPHWLVAASLIALVAWLSSYFLQLVLLPIIIVGQNVQAESGNARAAKQFEDVEVLRDDVARLLLQVTALRDMIAGSQQPPGAGTS